MGVYFRLLWKLYMKQDEKESQSLTEHDDAQ